MVDAEQHWPHGGDAFRVSDLDALEEEPDPEPRDDSHHNIERVHYLLVLRPGDGSPSRAFTAVANAPRSLPRPAAPARCDDAIATPRGPASPQARRGRRERAIAPPGAHRP